jgi:hypothetical protein
MLFVVFLCYIDSNNSELFIVVNTALFDLCVFSLRTGLGFGS